MRLLALVDSPDHVCCRYRIRAFEPALARAGYSLTCQGMSSGILARPRQLAQTADFDVVILQRKLLPPWQLAVLRKHARRLVFDFDDAVLFRDSYDSRGPHSTRRARRFAATVQSVDAVIAGNDFLADCALRAGAPARRVQTIPTCIEPESYTTASEVPIEGHLDLVWIGSASTLQGLQRQQALWERLGREIPGLRLRVICDRFPSLKSIPVVPVSWSKESEARDLAAGHIGVSWIPDDPWSRGKCALKVLQYQAAGLPVVANPVGMHAEVIEPGVTGFLPNTPDDWVRAIRTLASDPGQRRRMGRVARQRVESEFSVSAWSDTFVSCLAGVDSRGAEDEAPVRTVTSRAIPEPFFLRLRRTGAFDRMASPFRFDGSGNPNLD